MSNWAKGELIKIAETDDLHIAPFREHGTTYGTLTWIWSVVVDGALYVRAYNGKQSRWYQAAMRQKAGRIAAAGMTKEVSFEPVEGSIVARIDEAYRAKYRRSPYLAPMIGERARAATVDANETRRETGLSNKQPPSAVRKSLGDLAPKLVELTEDVLFGDVWERPQLSKRDRSLITCAALVATGKTDLGTVAR